MMDGCGAMMQGGRNGRPNDQWRRAPAQPDRDPHRRREQLADQKSEAVVTST
jgi:hypothetical protein